MKPKYTILIATTILIFAINFYHVIIRSIAGQISEAFKIERYIEPRKLENFQNYVSHLEYMESHIEKATFNDYISLEKERLRYELQIARVVKKMLDAYRG